MCAGVPMALSNWRSIRPAVAMNRSGSIANRSSSLGVSPGTKPRLSSRVTRMVGFGGGCPGVASLLLGWSIRLQPVFHRQSRDALKFALVVGDDRGAERQGVRCDQEIIRAYRLSRLFEVQP
jgi:hypothetical protein